MLCPLARASIHFLLPSDPVQFQPAISEEHLRTGLVIEAAAWIDRCPNSLSPLEPFRGILLSSPCLHLPYF